MKRDVLRRRCTTTTQKMLPSVKEVNRRMREIQRAIVTGGYASVNTLNADKTDICFGAGPIPHLVLEDDDCSGRPDVDEKSRFTSLETGAETNSAN